LIAIDKWWAYDDDLIKDWKCLLCCVSIVLCKISLIACLVSCLRIAEASSVFQLESLIRLWLGVCPFDFWICLCCGVFPICRDLDIIFYWCIYELMTWLLEVYAIFPLWCLIVEIFMHVVFGELFEDVMSISWIFIIFAWFITLIQIQTN